MSTTTEQIVDIKCDTHEEPNQGSKLNTKKKRTICPKCERPIPSACICVALPVEKLLLRYTYCIILQHPNEAKQHQNRTLPFIEYCIDSKCYTKLIGRRFPSMNRINDVESMNLKCVNNPNVNVFMNAILNCSNQCELQFPSNTMIWLLSPNIVNGIPTKPLSQALYEWDEEKEKCCIRHMNHPKLILIVLDATWKYVKEMDRANVQHHCYPPNVQRVHVSMEEYDIFRTTLHDYDDNCNIHTQSYHTHHRFAIRTPPKSKTSYLKVDADTRNNQNSIYLSTAECMAYVLSQTEQNHEIYHTIMKPLDLMVQQWQSYYSPSST